MNEKYLMKLQLLYQQGRFKEAAGYISDLLQEDADDPELRFYLANSYYLDGQLPEARRVAEDLMNDDPENMAITELMANIDLAEDKYADADLKADWLLKNDDAEPDYFILKAKVKLAQRYYDAALDLVDKALEIDAEDEEALNIRVMITNIIDPAASSAATAKMMELNPENPTSMANYGMTLLQQGKHKEALEKFKEALQIQPSNYIARMGMMEALKSRFFIYRWIYKFFSLTSKLDGNKIWMLIFGVMVLQRLLRSAADNTEGGLKLLLTGITVAISIFIFLTWVINPLMNLYLSLNPYGKLLLDEDDKKMAKFTGMSLLAAVVCVGISLVFLPSLFLVLAFFFLVMMIPLGTYLNPDSKEKKDRLKYITFGLLAIGMVVILFLPNMMFLLGIGIIGYQFYYNSIMISDYARKYE